MKMRPEMNTYYTVTESQQQRQYSFRQQNYTNHPHQDHNLMQYQQRVHHGSQTNQRHHNNPYSQYQNSSPHQSSSSTSKESIRLCNPFDESSPASSSNPSLSTSNNNSNMMTSYMDRNSSAG